MNNKPKPEGMDMFPTNTQPNTTIDYESSLRDLWEQHVGYVPSYPVTWESHVRPLIEGMDFVIPEGGLDYLATVGLLIAPGPDQWGADDVCHLIGACETMRWWRESEDSQHWPKFSKYQRGRIIAQANGRFEGLATNMDKFTIRHLALMVVQAKTKDQQDQAFASLETKLIVEGLA